MSNFFCSSEVGRPCSFWRWSHIIFSTMPRVSPSRSDSLLVSGVILETSILGAVVTTCAHHSILLTLSRWISTVLVPSEAEVRVQVESSTRTGWERSPCACVSVFGSRSASPRAQMPASVVRVWGEGNGH
ncbi:hypothetical protein CTA1_10415 [Colletotrichum tanaceti]|uniref:Uncharacterized protein n=1 Tax=Colletotrichum tanaceti TaxID=1306861 RepID=A0A4U6XUL7_9PEZI|nr:hypothetical protein CTA1_10415 [Colletotrichum tanaceti]